MSVIHVVNRQPGFVQIDNDTVQDRAISYKARGMLAYLLSRKPGRKVTVEDLVAHTTDGKTAVRSGLQELKEAGYASFVTIQDSDTGQLEGRQWFVFELPRMNPWLGDESPSSTSDEIEQRFPSPPISGFSQYRETRQSDNPPHINTIDDSNTGSTSNEVEGTQARAREASGDGFEFSFDRQGLRSDSVEDVAEWVTRPDSRNQKNKRVTRVFWAHFECQGDWSIHGRLAKLTNAAEDAGAESGPAELVRWIRSVHRDEDLEMRPTGEEGLDEELPERVLNYLTKAIREEEKRYSDTFASKLPDLTQTQ